MNTRYSVLSVLGFRDEIVNTPIEENYNKSGWTGGVVKLLNHKRFSYAFRRSQLRDQ